MTNLRTLIALFEAPAAPAPPAPDEPLPIGTRRLLGPAYGTGQLWRRAPDVAPSGALDLGLGVALLDSAIAVKIQAILDTIPAESFATARMPKWTANLNGKPWGFDGKWIYLGGIKVPAAILALLPLPSGNYEQAQRAEALERMRQDIVQAAWRAQNGSNSASRPMAIRSAWPSRRICSACWGSMIRPTAIDGTPASARTRCA